MVTSPTGSYVKLKLWLWLGQSDTSGPNLSRQNTTRLSSPTANRVFRSTRNTVVVSFRPAPGWLNSYQLSAASRLPYSILLAKQTCLQTLLVAMPRMYAPDMPGLLICTRAGRNYCIQSFTVGNCQKILCTPLYQPPCMKGDPERMPRPQMDTRASPTRHPSIEAIPTLKTWKSTSRPPQGPRMAL